MLLLRAMKKNLAEADDRLAKFWANSKGTISTPTEFTWKQGEKRANLDHGISWTSHLASPRAVFNDTAHHRFDHAMLSFGLSTKELSRNPQPTRKLLAPTDRIEAVFFQNLIRAWQEAVQNKMLPASDETDGNALISGDATGRSRGDEGRGAQTSATRGQRQAASQRTSARAQQGADCH